MNIQKWNFKIIDIWMFNIIVVQKKPISEMIKENLLFLRSVAQRSIQNTFYIKAN